MSDKKPKEFGHICHLCSMFTPGTLGRQLCENNLTDKRNDHLARACEQINAIYRFLALKYPEEFDN